MMPNQTEGIDEARRTDMNREPIYPLPEYDPGDEVPRSVNERLAPIFRALADDPDGWQIEWLHGGSWHASANDNLFPPRLHEHCNKFRLVPKRRTPNETAEYWADWLLDAVAASTQDRRFLRGDDEYDGMAGEAILRNAKKAIHNAMEGK